MTEAHCQVKQCPGKGKGQFAKHDFEAGTLVICEEAMFCTADLTPSGIYSAYLTTTTASQKNIYRTLHGGSNLQPLSRGSEVPQTEDQYFKEDTRELAFEQSVETANAARGFPLAETQQSGKAVARFENNAFKLHLNDGNDKPAWAIFPLAARLDHSCVPNCYAYWNEDEGKLRVYAIEHITIDEELTIAYGDCFTELRDERRARLKTKYGFDCQCGICDKNSPDSAQVKNSRRQMRNLQQAIDGLRTAKYILPEEIEGKPFQLFKLFEQHARGFSKVQAQINMGRMYQRGGNLIRAGDEFYHARNTASLCLGESHKHVAAIDGHMKTLQTTRNYREQLSAACASWLALFDAAESPSELARLAEFLSMPAPS